MGNNSTSPGEAREALKEAAAFIIRDRLESGISANARILTIPNLYEGVADASSSRYATA